MNPKEIIQKKRDGEVLSEEEIGYFIRAYTSSAIADYHAAALLMAIYFQGMTSAEAFALTRTMRSSGEVLDLSSITAKKVDKHSTGGVGDKTSLIVAPIAAACGLIVPMITGRALASIPGFRSRLTKEEVVGLLVKNKAVLMGQTDMLARADRKLYALRDAIAAVESIPLMTSSILSKKLAEDLDGLVLDVKTGSGALTATKELSMELARALVSVCRKMKVEVVAVISDMDQPLGRAVGNALEVKECIDCLKGKGPEDLESLSVALAGEMIRIAGLAQNQHESRRIAQEALSSGRALHCFSDIVGGQGGDIRVIDFPERLPKSLVVTSLAAKRTGVIVRADAKLIGMACGELGASRVRLDDPVDPGVGIYLHKKLGDRVERGETLCDIHWNDESRLRDATPMIEEAFEIGSRAPRRKPLIHEIIRGS
jgi:pyrimidine-nucleoside phosphorylase/thymidine phosphorylase